MDHTFKVLISQKAEGQNSILPESRGLGEEQYWFKITSMNPPELVLYGKKHKAENTKGEKNLTLDYSL